MAKEPITLEELEQERLRLEGRSLGVYQLADQIYKGPGKRYAVDEVRFEDMNDPRFSLDIIF